LVVVIFNRRHGGCPRMPVAHCCASASYVYGVTGLSWPMQQLGVLTRDVLVLGELATAVRLVSH
jgi:hypothetical protein